MTTDDARDPLVVDEADSDDADTLCERVVRCVAAATNTVATDLPPLQYTVDTAALKSLYGRGDARPPSVSFDYATVRITIGPDATVAVYEVQARGVESPTD